MDDTGRLYYSGEIILIAVCLVVELNDVAGIEDGKNCNYSLFLDPYGLEVRCKRHEIAMTLSLGSLAVVRVSRCIM